VYDTATFRGPAFLILLPCALLAQVETARIAGVITDPAGGPVVRNKTLFFGDYEWTKIRESRTYLGILGGRHAARNYAGISESVEPAAGKVAG
jgi:hypothetical protein